MVSLHVSRAVSATLLLFVSAACTRSEVVGPMVEAQCVWPPAVEIDIDLTDVGDTAFAITDGRGTAMLFANDEEEMSTDGFYTVVVNDRLEVIGHARTPGWVIRAARLEQGRLSMVALGVDSGECVYRELDTNGNETRRLVLLTGSYPVCRENVFAITDEEVLYLVPGALGDGSANIRRWSRTTLAESEFEVAPERTLTDVEPSADSGAFVSSLFSDAPTGALFEGFAFSDGTSTRVTSLETGSAPWSIFDGEISAHGDLFLLGLAPSPSGAPMPTIVYPHDDGTVDSLSLEGLAATALLPVSTNRRTSVFLGGLSTRSSVDVWTFDRESGEEELVSLDAWDEPTAIGATSTASSAAQGYAFWARGDKLYGSVLHCLP